MRLVVYKAADALCSQPTYEGLKRKVACDNAVVIASSQPTYEGLKLESVLPTQG